jgi:hypothetical protein
MANLSATPRMAEAIEATKRRIAECEGRIARLGAIGASTRSAQEFLKSLHETLALQRLLLGLSQSYTELASLKRQELRLRLGTGGEDGGRSSGAAPEASRAGASSRVQASAPADRDPSYAASASPRKS